MMMMMMMMVILVVMWSGFYIDNVQGNKDVVDPLITLPDGSQMRWSQQYLQGGRVVEQLQ